MLPNESIATRLTLGLKCLTLLGALSLVAQAQTIYDPPSYVPPPQSEPIVVETLRPVSPNPSLATTATAPKGMTFVSVEPGLENLLRGGEPRSVKELLAMEVQQKKVMAKIGEVTVNVQQGAAQGSGVIINSEGYIFTAAHVAGKPNRQAYVTLSDGRRLRAKTLGMNRNMDAGLIKIVESEGTDWPHASLGESRSLRAGQWVIATGHPGGWTHGRPAVMRVGRILENLDSTIVTDCALIGGDSGGPLFNMKGQLIGIHSRIGTDVADNMHVPVSVFEESWERLARSEAWGMLPGYQPVIGIRGNQDNDEPVIASITRDGPAEQAGLQVGDRILEFDGAAINSFSALKRAVDSTLPGDHVIVKILRGEATQSIEVVVGLSH